ncbi:sensor histidine kinase [Patescibacteria group bacterium]
MDLQKIKFGTLLGIGIAGIVGLMVLATTYLNYLSNSTQNIIESSTSRIFDVLTIQRDTEELFSALDDVVVIQDQHRLVNVKDRVSSLFERAYKTIDDGREKQIFIESEAIQAREILNNTSDISSRIFNLKEDLISRGVDKGDRFGEEAKDLSSQFNRLRSTRHEMLGLVHQVIIRSDDEFRGAMDLVQKSQIITWVVVGASLALALFLGYFIVRFAKRVYDIKNEIIYVIAHDLRNPVTAILGHLDLIMTGKDMNREDKQESLQAIEISTQKLRTQINNMLEVGRTESGFVKLNLEPIRAVDVIEESVLRAKALAEMKEMKINYEKTVGKDVYVLADREKLSGVLDNLISNALKYNREKGLVTITTKDVREIFSILVTDTGHGIPDDQKKELFKKYSRLDTKSGKGIGGTGLGLFTSKLSMEKMKGTIKFESTVNQGTTFTVSLKKISKEKKNNNSEEREL